MRIEQAVTVEPGCKIHVNYFVSEKMAKVIIGERSDGAVLRVGVPDKETCDRLAVAFAQCAEMFDHLDATGDPFPSGPGAELASVTDLFPDKGPA